MTPLLATKPTAAVLAAITLFGGSSAVAKKGGGRKPEKPRPVVTKMKFKLADHEYVAGEELTGSVAVFARSGRRWEPLPGVEVSVRVNGEQVDALTTDDQGKAAVSYVVDPDDSVMKVVFAGDGGHRRAKRAQGFEVLDPAEDAEAPTES